LVLPDEGIGSLIQQATTSFNGKLHIINQVLQRVRSHNSEMD